jgi:hypothetical protein
MADQRIESFLKSAPGKYFDPDGVYKFQCVDVILAYALHLWPGVGIRESVGWGNAKDYLDGRPVKYWKTVRNVWGSAALPPRGAVCVWGGPSTTYGHVAVNLGATQAGVSGLQQNVAGGGNEPTTIGFLPWDLGKAGYFIGWLEPVLGPVVKPAGTTTKDWFDMATEKQLEALVERVFDAKVRQHKLGSGGWAYKRRGEKVDASHMLAYVYATIKRVEAATKRIEALLKALTPKSIAQAVAAAVIRVKVEVNGKDA